MILIIPGRNLSGMEDILLFATGTTSPRAPVLLEKITPVKWVNIRGGWY